MRNSDLNLHISDAEHARRAGDPRGAYDGFLEAGRCAEQYGLWKTALRCYRQAVELDTLSPRAVEHLVRVSHRAGAGSEWTDYITALMTAPAWPAISCRDIQLVIGSSGAVARSPSSGPVLHVAMEDGDEVAISPDPRFIDIPVAMALLVVRRALWPAPREHSDSQQALEVRVTYGRHRFRLFEHGDWIRL